jgi:hypothetical protein
MNVSDDKYIDVCQNIEAGLKVEYERNSRLTDERCSYALERAKAAVKHRFGYGANESSSVSPELQGIVDWCVAVAAERVNESTGPTLKEFLARMDKVNRSVRRHAHDGSRSYYEFIRPFFP